jgi:PKD repeat protein
MKKITLLISAVALTMSGIIAQKIDATKTTANFQRCSSTEVMQALRDQDPAAFDANKKENEQKMQDWIANNYDPAAKKVVVYIPVVVQIWENTSVVPDVRVTQQIARLNADFGRTNTDAGNTPGVFSAVDTEIQFCLASVDPSGNPTTGIIRRPAGGQAPGSGGTEMWDPTKYLNLYVYTLGGGVLGFAYPNQMQAVHITDGAFGNTSGAFNLGRTATHEVGHHFNLSHIWGDATCGNDFVADTPTQQDPNYGCTSHPSPSCGNSGDMFMNYMDYVNDNCMNAFTLGQKTRMWASLNTVRVGLLTSSATNCTALPITAAFSANVTTINAGQSVTFTDASFGPNTITSYNWDFDVTGIGGVTAATANTVGPHVVTYNTAGLFTVSLLVGDGSGTDTESKTGYILVNPAGTITCDSTAAGWDWISEAIGPALWGADCNNPTSGYIMGHNCYDDNGWATIVPFSQTGKELTEVMYTFVQSTGSGVTNLTVWGADGAGFDAGNTAISTAPGTIMATNVTTSGAYSGNLGSLISMPIVPAVALNGDFYIGIDHPAAPGVGDTLTLGTAAGTGANNTWANEAGIGWRDIAFWGVDYKGAVIAVICDIATGVKSHTGTITETVIYPNPTTGDVKILMPSKMNSSVVVYNVVGKEIFSTTKNSNFVEFNLSNHPNGVYIVNVQTGDEILTKKIILSK